MTSGSRKRLLSTDELERGAEEISRIVAVGAPPRVAILGGYAMQIYGSDRLTGDLDVVAQSPITGLRPQRSLTFGGYATATPSGIPLDVIIRDDDYTPLYEAALETSRRVRGVPLHVVRPEHLAAIKMACGRGKDDLDLLFLLAHMGPKDRRTARKIAKQFLGPYAANDLDARVAEADWRRSRGEFG